jgi:ABC-type multidrug transport system fused ATPase/permease subunit
VPVGEQDGAAQATAATGQARRAAFAHLSRLLTIASMPRWATPSLIVLGLGSSLAETAGIALIILFFYSAMGQLDTAASTGGVLGRALHYASHRLGSSAQIAAVIFLLIVARGAPAFANNVISAYVSEQINEKARNLIHEQYLTVAYSFIQRHEWAQLMQVLGTESWLIAGAYASLTRVVISGCSVLVFAGFLLALSWQIALAALVGSLLISAGLRRLSEPARELGQRSSVSTKSSASTC